MRDRQTLPVIVPSDTIEGPEQVDPEVHGVVLAAGMSNRYGERNKLLEPLNDEPIVRHATETLLDKGLAGITVVVGYEAEAVHAAVEDLAVDVRFNAAFEKGQSTSVATGIEAAIENDVNAAVLALGDMPFVSASSIKMLLSAYEAGAGSALAVACEGDRGNPVLFDERYFDDLSNVDGDVGGREILLSGDDAIAVETGDRGVLRDVDRPSDL